MKFLFKKNKNSQLTENELEDLFNKNFQDKNWELSEEYVKRLLKIDPKSLTYMILKRDFLYESNQFKKCIKWCDKVIKEYPSEISFYMKKGYANFILDNNKKAIESFEKAYEKKSGSIDDYCEKAIQSAKPNKLEIVDYFIEKALCLESDNLQVLLLKSKIYYEYGKYKDALKILETINKNESNDKNILNFIGKCYTKLGKPLKAIEIHEKILNENLQDIDALNGFGFALLKLKKSEEAMEYFERVLFIDHININANNGMGISLVKYKKFLRGNPRKDEAKKYFQVSLKQDATNPETIDHYTDYLLEMRGTHVSKITKMLDDVTNRDLTNTAYEKARKLRGERKRDKALDFTGKVVKNGINFALENHPFADKFYKSDSSTTCSTCGNHHSNTGVCLWGYDPSIHH